MLLREIMKTRNLPCVVAPIATLLLLALSLTSPQGFGAADGLRASELTPAEQREYVQIQKRVKARGGDVTGACFEVCHLVDENEVRRVETTLNLVLAFADPSQIAKIIEAGGVARAKDSLASLLKHKNPVISRPATAFCRRRCFSALQRQAPVD
jgi:hypothetical protein